MPLKVKTTKELLEEERAKNAALREQLDKNSANLDYVAMMADVEIPSEEETQEVSDDE